MPPDQSSMRYRLLPAKPRKPGAFAYAAEHGATRSSTHP
ncbi:MAG: hypothetical protein OJF49_004048 [Ktedonobacterales bacterium]|nr:MAG: hypothetical protein OJF49_004048 [Ktedonobacterales bacterium]